MAVGHWTVAELVWRQMGPAERRAASDLLRQHPHYKVLLAADVPAGVDTNEWAFLNAAVWPDRVRPARPGQPHKPRSITKYDVLSRTRLAIPSCGRADANRVSLDKFFIAKPNAEMALSNSLVTLRNPQGQRARPGGEPVRALHLCGDLHQPLHTANLVTKDKPQGHGLGGAFLVLDQRGEPTDLHAFWDQSPGPDLSYQAVAALADKLAAAPELQPAGCRSISSTGRSPPGCRRASRWR